MDPLPKIESPQESRFGAWMVTGGADGTVRVWDPETGVEKFRHTATSTNGWLDLLGVMRTKSVPTKQTTSFWAEPISVPDEMGQRHDILMLSTLGKPVDLFEGATLGDTDFALRFLCQDLPLMLDATQTNWQILPWNKHKFGRSFLHGVFGCDSGKAESPVPRLAGIPIEIVKLEQIELLETLKPWPNPAQFVTLSEIEFSAVLANPADPSPKGHTTPPDPEEVTTIGLRFKRKASGNGYDLEVKGDSRFDWRFPLTEQSPVGTVSVLPGRLARLEGSVTLVNGRLQLTPESTFSTADALGHLRPLENPPVMVFDPGSTKGKTVRFREKALPEKAPLELLGNGLPHPFPDKKIPIVATDLGNDSSEAPVVLLAAQPAEKEKAGRMLLADLATGRRRVRYGDTLRRARLVSEPLDDTKQRLTVVGIADDGTVRIRRLFEIEKTLTDGVKEKEVAADQQEWARFALPSPAEDVQVFDVLSADRKSIANRWLLARCRDGSAWLWNAQSGAQRYELSIPGTAVSVVAFGPAVPQEIFEKDKTDYDPWRDVFGTVSPRLIEKNGLEAFVAIGGNDGSVRIYAVDRTAPPALVRSFFVLDEPIQSLSLAIDKSSFEALTLRRVGDRTKPLPGLVLLACDGNGPCRLHEILSGLSLIEKEEADRPEVLRKETSALRGVLIPDNTTLHIVVETVRDDNRSVVSLMKKTKNLRTSFDASDIHPLPEIPQGVATELVRSDGPLKFAQCLAVNTGESGWSVYEFGGNGFTHLHEEKVNIVDAAVIEVFEQRYLVAVQSEGQLSAWVQTSPSGNAADWKPIVNPVNDHPVRVDAATFGRVVVPMVACRGVAGHLGHAWGIDLDSVEFTWPETLGPVEDSALVAMTCLRGVPLLAVASPRDVTVWDLATGLLVHRLGLDQSPVKLDMASDLDTLWLLVSDKKGTWRLAAPAVDSSFSPPLKLGSRTDFVEMRLMCLPAGLRLVTVGPDVANSNTLLDVTIPKKELNATSLKSVSVTMSPVDCRILDVTVVNNEFWVLLANSTGLRVIQLKTAGADFSIPVVGNSPNTDPVAAVFDLDPDPADSTLPRVWTVDESWTKITAWRKTTPAAGPPAFSKQDASSFERGGRHSQVTGSPKTLGAVKCDGRTRLVALAEGGLAVWDVADQALVRSEPLE
ncbi:MAG: hypothetical protein NT069_21735, partial [Planctomycetota bacterium]|nr:hypothetical protein [Planctomycetota bacterium]